MQEVQTWRELLGYIIRDNKEKQRITEELGITPITLNRWVNGESDPRSQNMRLLITVLPQYREQLIELIRQEKGLSDFTLPPPDDLVTDIPSEFYARVFVGALQQQKTYVSGQPVILFCSRRWGNSTRTARGSPVGLCVACHHRVLIGKYAACAKALAWVLLRGQGI